MNNKTSTYYSLAKMYSFIIDIEDMYELSEKNFNEYIHNNMLRHAINMCLVQLGEEANKISKSDYELYNNPLHKLRSIKGLRDRIVHGYGKIIDSLIRDVLDNGIPELKIFIEETVHEDILENPYMLHEIEYDDYIKRLNEQKHDYSHDKGDEYEL